MWASGYTGAGTSLLLVQPCQKWTPESESKRQAKSKEAEPVPLALPCQQAAHSLLEAGLLLWNKWNPAETMRGIKRFCALLFQRGENWSSVCRAEEWAPCCIHTAEDTAEALSRNMSLMECVAIRKESLVTHPVLSAVSAVTGGGL